MTDLIEFGVNSFVRISDLKDLQHKHVKVVKNDPSTKATFVELTVPNSKVKNKDTISVTMQKAVRVYERLQARHELQKLAEPDDFVFYPHWRNRSYALHEIGRLFQKILEENGLRRDAKGRSRTLYSLRHTALMFRLLYGEKPDLLLLAKNALTSVQMLEKFYLSHVETRMKVRELQAFAGGQAVYELSGSHHASKRLERKRKA